MKLKGRAFFFMYGIPIFSKRKKYFSVFLLQHVLVCLKYYFYLHVLSADPGFQLDLESWGSL